MSFIKRLEKKFLVVGVPIFGLVILLAYLPKFNPLTDPTILIFISMIFISENLSVQLPSGVNLSLSSPFIICSLLLFGLVKALWVFLPGFVLYMLIQKVKPYKIIFNVSQIAIALYVANLFIPHTNGFTLSHDIIWIVGVIIAFDLLNSGLVVKFHTLLHDQNFFQEFIKIWFHEVAAVRTIYNTTGLIMAILYQSQGLPGISLVVLPIFGAFILLNTQTRLKYQTDKANTDQLTQLGNRYALTNWWDENLEYILSSGQDLVVVMIDLDDFKLVNDRHGHNVGDEVLKMVASDIENCIRQNDSVFRYGGEEFVLILSDTDIRGAKAVTERVRESIPQIKFDQYPDIKLTVSIGLSKLNNNLLDEKEDIPGELLRRADNAMYLAKQNGKNQVQLYS